jgi:F0F1-type ATP synthase membrane subunit b/b'
MDQTLQALGGIILNGLPTFFLLLILAVCVKYLYLNPLDKVLAERFRLTEGARKAAEESLKNADTKVAEYETALGQARSEIYREQNEYLRKLRDEQAERIRAARAESDARVAAAKTAIAQEAKAAELSLEAQSEILAAQIADSILSRRAA